MKLLVHVCCAVDACNVFRELAQEYEVGGYFYDPNIQPKSEYDLRLQEAKRVAEILDVPMHEAPYDVENFFHLVKGYEQDPEKGMRCGICFQMRMEETALACAELGYDAFTTTLTVSPHKNAELINELGTETAPRYGVKYFPSNFKKNDGYLKSTRYAKELDLYRQNYCGCIMSIRSDAPEPYIPERLKNSTS